MAVLFKGKILNDDEINYLSEITQTENWEKLEYGIKENNLYMRLDKLNRENKLDETYNVIKNKIKNKLESIISSEVNVSAFENLIKYEKGGYISNHRDLLMFQSAITLVSPTSEFEGGKLYVSGEYVEVEYGDTVIIEDDKHEVKEVTDGTRIVYALWFD